jgi:hypothetical protein
MDVAAKYNPQTAWRTLAKDVFQLTRETINTPATYRLTVKAIDSNNPGAGSKDVGYYLVDYMGVPFRIIAVSEGAVDVSDDFRAKRCPTSGQMAIIYQSVYGGRALYLSPDNFQHLHPGALANSHKYDVALLWANDPNAKQVPFTATSIPTISTYQDDQVDPDDVEKTINYASDFGENPLVRCIVTVDATHRYQLQQAPLFTYVDGKIDTIHFELNNEESGYLLISKA